MFAFANIQISIETTREPIIDIENLSSLYIILIFSQIASTRIAIATSCAKSFM